LTLRQFKPVAQPSDLLCRFREWDSKDDSKQLWR